MAAVVDHQIEDYLAPQRTALDHLDGWEQLERYLAGIAAGHERRELAGGCPVGSLALELAGHDEALRRRLAAAVEGWERRRPARLADRGLLREQAPVERLAAATLATIQGAYRRRSALSRTDPPRRSPCPTPTQIAQRRRRGAERSPVSSGSAP